MVGISILGALFIESGCATTNYIKSLPRPEEFQENLADLKIEYPDLVEWSYLRCFTVYCLPDATALVSKWDKPHHSHFSITMLMPPILSWILYPTKVWTWEFGGKKITAIVQRPIVLGYKPRLWKLKVTEVKKK